VKLEKEFTIKNPESFIFSKIFSPEEACNKFFEGFKNDGKIQPQSLGIFKLQNIKKHRHQYFSYIRFKGKINGSSFYLHPVKEINKFFNNKYESPKELIEIFIKTSKLQFSQILNTDTVIDKLVCSLTNLSKLKIKNEDLSIRITNNIILNSSKFPYYQYITSELINEFSKIVLGEDRYDMIRSDPSFLFTTIKELNSSFYREWIKSKKIFEKVELKVPEQEIDFSKEEVEIKFEELHLLPDRGIRKLLEELTNQNIKAKQTVFALYDSSEELKEKFYKNMSKNRFREIREGMEIWEPETDDILKAQEIIVQTIINLSKEKKISLSPALRKKLFILIRKLDKEKTLEAGTFIKGGEFVKCLNNINKVILQLLIRNVSRKVLIAAFQYMNEEVKEIVNTNMSETGIVILSEDIEHWNKTIEDEEYSIIAIADSQKTVIDKAKKIEKKLRTDKF